MAARDARGDDLKFNEFGGKSAPLRGSRFPASAALFKGMFDPKGGPDEVVIDFYDTRVYTRVYGPPVPRRLRPSI